MSSSKLFQEFPSGLLYLIFNNNADSFPQFGPGILPQHGFARSSLWKIKSTSSNENSVSVTLSLEDSDETKKVWDNKFSLEYLITLDSQDHLHLSLSVFNKNEGKPFSFTTALHTYFQVGNVQRCQILGLSGLTFIDKVAKGEKIIEKNNTVQFKGETDRVYLNSPAEIRLTGDREILLIKENFSDCVVWNPGSEKVKDMLDVGTDEWTTFACVEVAAVGSPVELTSHRSTWAGKLDISLLDRSIA